MIVDKFILAKCSVGGGEILPFGFFLKLYLRHSLLKLAKLHSALNSGLHLNEHYDNGVFFITV
jgi:hypothetical protein